MTSRAPGAVAVPPREGGQGSGHLLAVAFLLLFVAAEIAAGGGQATEGRSLLDRGVELRRKQPSEAGPVLERALARLVREGDLGGQAEAHRNLGILERLAGRTDEALRRYETALGLARQAGEDDVVADVLNSLGILYRLRGDHARALEAHAEGLVLARRGGDPAAQARLLGSIFRLYDEMGAPAAAERAARLALVLAERGGAPVDMLAAHMGHLATTLARRGEAWEALRLLDRIEELPGLDDTAKWAADNTRALIHRGLGDLERAEAFARRAMEGVRRTGGAADILGIQHNLALIAQERGDPEEASRLLQEALEGLERLGDPYKSLYVLNALTTLELERGRTAVAASWNDRALRLVARAGLSDPYGLEDLYRARSTIAEHQGDLGAAARSAEHAVRLADATPEPDGRAKARERLGEVERERGNRERAEALFREAIGIRRELRARLPSSEMRRMLGRARSRPWRLLAFSLLDRGAEAGDRDLTAEAARLLDGSRAETFLETLARAGAARHAEERGAGEGEGEGEEEAAAERAIAEIQAHLLREEGDPARREELRRRLLLAEERLAAEGRKVQGPASPGAVTRPDEVSMEVLGAALAAESAVLVQFALSPERGWAILCAPDALEAVPVAGALEIESLASGIESLLTPASGGEAAPDPVPALDRLSTMLLDPWVDRVPTGTRRFLIVPDGILQRVPFEALRLSGTGDGPRRYLAEAYTVAYVPSAASWLALRRRGEGGPELARILAVADPPYPLPDGVERLPGRPRRLERLPASRDEATRVARLGSRGSRILVGEAATEAAWKREALDQFRVIHVAAHGIADLDRPMRSGIVLAPGDAFEDGLIQMREILASPLRADLVVLSACRSGVGPVDRAEGIVSLPLAFLEAGARAVVATLWEVEDTTTSEFMRRFYDALARGEGPAEAARTAKVQMLASADPRLARPGAWAPFVVVGAPGGSVALGGARPGATPWIVAGGLAALVAGWLLWRGPAHRRRKRNAA